jgi:hypothetical protein
MQARHLAERSVFYALFRVVELAELEDAEKALEWAQSAVDSAELRHGLVDRVSEVLASEGSAEGG